MRKTFVLTIVFSSIAAILAAMAVGLLGGPSHRLLQLGPEEYRLEVAAEVADRARGLGHRAELPKREGMLFVFDAERVQCFWMKDVQFPLDIIWLDAGKRVVHLASDVSPGSYPSLFCPDTPARYVIELNAGEAAAARLEAGQTLQF